MSEDLQPDAPSPCAGVEPGGPCDDALHDLYVYLDGELTEERRALIRLHIEECGPCLEAFDFEYELRVLVSRTCHSEAPDALRDRVAEALRQCADERARSEPDDGEAH